MAIVGFIVIGVAIIWILYKIQLAYKSEGGRMVVTVYDAGEQDGEYFIGLPVVIVFDCTLALSRMDPRTQDPTGIIATVKKQSSTLFEEFIRI